jgi:hypothetical protein
MTPAPADALDTAAVIACSASKLTHTAPAGDLYRGDLFRASRQWSEHRGMPWLILSARHGLVHPATAVAPYNARLGSSRSARQALAARVRLQWPDAVGQMAAERAGWHPARVVVLGGKLYADVTRTALAGLDLDVDAPLQALPSRGLGYYKRWLKATGPGHG